MKKADEAGEAPRVLVVKLSSLGDLFCALPAVHCIKQGMGATVDWVTQPEYGELVRCFCDVEEVLLFPRRAYPTRAWRFYRRLRARVYDRIIDLQGLLKSACLVGRFARGRQRLGPAYSREGARWFYTETAEGDVSAHAVEQALDVVRHMGLDVAEVRFPVVFPKPELSSAGPRVAFVPCSRWRSKDWPPQQFAQLGRVLQEQAGAVIYLVGGNADRATCRRIAEALTGETVNLCGTTRLPETGGYLAEMDLVVSVDSGPMHMAAAQGVPVLALFGTTDPRRTGPYGNGHHVLLSEAAWQADNLARKYKKEKDNAPWHITTEKVVEAALEMLASRKRSGEGSQ